MELWVTIFAISVSSSIDNLGVGISYGIRGIRIGFRANFIISIIAFIFSEAGILFGQFLSRTLPGEISNVIGALFLIIIGLRIVLLTFQKKKTTTSESRGKKRQPLSNYLSSPENADFDKNGEIGFGESIVLGIAVSMNALTNGLGAGLIGLSPLAISLSAAVFSYLAVRGGVALGQKVSEIKIGSLTLGQFSTVISGIILLLIAAHSLF